MHDAHGARGDFHVVVTAGVTAECLLFQQTINEILCGPWVDYMNGRLVSDASAMSCQLQMLAVIQGWWQCLMDACLPAMLILSGGADI